MKNFKKTSTQQETIKDFIGDEWKVEHRISNKFVIVKNAEGNYVRMWKEENGYTFGSGNVREYRSLEAAKK